jgi:hypothetical protein
MGEANRSPTPARQNSTLANDGDEIINTETILTVIIGLSYGLNYGPKV